MLKSCDVCGAVLGNRSTKTTCLPCLKKCSKCGAKKDHRAEFCRSCASKIGAAKQWANPESRARIASGLANAGQSRRRRITDLVFGDFRMRKPDGRVYTFYWDDSNVRRYMYRYQWVWIQANGPIPKGHHIHHIDDDCTNDSIENLQCLTHSEHNALHLLDGRSVKMVKARGDEVTGKFTYSCLQCEATFIAHRRGVNKPRLFCSKSCSAKHQVAQRGLNRQNPL